MLLQQKKVGYRFKNDKMEELIIKSQSFKSDASATIFWGSLDIENIRIEQFDTGVLFYNINVTDFYSKYQMKALQVGHYRVLLKVKYRGIIQKEMRVI